MLEITFMYKRNEIPIQYSKGEKMKDIKEILSKNKYIKRWYISII